MTWGTIFSTDAFAPGDNTAREPSAHLSSGSSNAMQTTTNSVAAASYGRVSHTLINLFMMGICVINMLIAVSSNDFMVVWLRVLGHGKTVRIASAIDHGR